MAFRISTIVIRPTLAYVTQRSNGVDHVRSAVTGYHHYSTSNHFITSDFQHQEEATVVTEEETRISANEVFGNLCKSTTILDGYMKEEHEIFPKFLSPDQGVGMEDAADRHSRSPLMDLNTDAEAASTTMTDVPVFAETPNKNGLYWQKVPQWRNVSAKQFMEKKWQIANVVRDKAKLLRFLSLALPETIDSKTSGPFEHIRTREDFMEDVSEGIDMAPMAIRLTPHILSVIDWENALEDPIRRQFIPMKSSALPDHRMLTLDSLHEEDDSPVKGLVHRYADKALFLATSTCPLYCRFCTRSYAVGIDTDIVTKKTLRPTKQRWQDMFQYIEDTPSLHDIVVSGGDTYLLTPDQIFEIGTRLISIKHIRRFRFASKGLAVWPSRILDPTDGWATALIEVSKLGRKEGKAVALHTHFNHPNEITWITEMAARKLFTEGVTVRNQTVLLKGVNDDVATMSSLIRRLADINIQPYYVYQGDMVKGVEDLRTPLQTCLDLETQIRGSIAGFMVPQFVVDLPGGGGKRLAASHLTYNRNTGVSTFVAPAVTRGKHKVDKVYEYHDPVWPPQNGKTRAEGMEKP